MRISFSKRRLEMLRTPTGKRSKIYRDSVVRGLGVKLDPGGKRMYFWSRKVGAKAQWRTIGEFELTTLDEARAKAEEHNIARKKWKETGENPLAPPSGVTLGEVFAAYVERHVRLTPSHPERAADGVAGQARRCLKPFLDRKVASIRRGELLALRESVHKERGPSAANKLLQTIRAAVNWAVESELYKGANVAEGIPMFKEKKRRRFLYKHELDALRDALDKTPNRDLVDFVRLALMTGARKSDIYSMRWSDVALDRRTWLVPQPKGGEPYLIALTDPAVEILRARQNGSAWVFPTNPLNPSKSGHVMDMKRSWGQLLKLAGIEDVHQHDLRRTLASWQAAGGASLLVVGKSLGHKSTAATQIYAQLDLGPVRESVEAATRAMFAAPPKLLPAAKKAARR